MRERREGLRLSLRNPHPGSGDVAELGMDDWSDGIAADSDLIEWSGGRKVSWHEGKGWVDED